MTLLRSKGPLSPLGSSPSHWRAAGRLPAAVPASWRPRNAGRHPGLEIGRAVFPSTRARRGVGLSGCSGPEQCKMMRTPKGWAERCSRPAPPRPLRHKVLSLEASASSRLPVVSSASCQACLLQPQPCLSFRENKIKSSSLYFQE